MTRRRIAHPLLLAALVAAAGYVFVRPFLDPNSLRRSGDQIAASLLELTPPGTAREEVEALIKERGWPPGGVVINDPNARSVMLGQYRGFPFDITVFACWRFDARRRVRTVEVTKAALSAP
jgi:hypothetical protein